MVDSTNEHTIPDDSARANPEMALTELNTSTPMVKSVVNKAVTIATNEVDLILVFELKKIVQLTPMPNTKMRANSLKRF